MMDPRPGRAAIHIEIDSGALERAERVLSAAGTDLAGLMEAATAAGRRGRNVPFELTREPEAAGCGMSEDEAARLGIAVDGTDGRTGEPAEAEIPMDPAAKREMRLWCREMLVSTNQLAAMLIGQVAFELRVPFRSACNDAGAKGEPR